MPIMTSLIDAVREHATVLPPIDRATDAELAVLDDVIGDDYRTIALTHTAGSVPDLHLTEGNALGFDVRDTPVEPPSPTSVEGALIGAGLGDVTTAVPLRGGLRTGPAPAGIRGQSAETALDVPAAFDAVITVPTATMTEHLTLY